MLRANYRDLRSGKILELKPRSFAQLLQYVDAKVLAESEIPRINFTSPSVSHRGSRRAQRSVARDLVPTLVVLLAMVAIYSILIGLRILLDRTTKWVTKIMVEYLGSWSPLQLVEGV